jgi:hypothetical protein
MSPNATQFWSHELVYDEVRSIATTEKTDTSFENQMSRGGAGSVLTNESVQTSAGDAGSIGDGPSQAVVSSPTPRAKKGLIKGSQSYLKSRTPTISGGTTPLP